MNMNILKAPECVHVKTGNKRLKFNTRLPCQVIKSQKYSQRLEFAKIV